MKHAVMIIIYRNNKFLLGKRAVWKSKAPGFWCPISGHVEIDESEEDAVRREANEELGIMVKPLQKITSFPSHDGTVMLHWWLSEMVAGEPKLANAENEELGWFTKEELRNLSPAFKEDLELLIKIPDESPK